MISDLLEDITSSSTSIITSKYAQNFEISNFVFGSNYDAHEWLIHTLHNFFPDIDQNISLNKGTEPAMSENENNPESGWGSNYSWKI